MANQTEVQRLINQIAKYGEEDLFDCDNEYMVDDAMCEMHTAAIIAVDGKLTEAGVYNALKEDKIIKNAIDRRLKSLTKEIISNTKCCIRNIKDDQEEEKLYSKEEEEHAERAAKEKEKQRLDALKKAREAKEKKLKQQMFLGKLSVAQQKEFDKLFAKTK
jgi:hypothetical protein